MGPPHISARYEIIRSCIAELVRVGFVSPTENVRPYTLLLKAMSSGASRAQDCGSAIPSDDLGSGSRSGKRAKVDDETERDGPRHHEGAPSALGENTPPTPLGGSTAAATATAATPAVARATSTQIRPVAAAEQLLHAIAMMTEGMSARYLRKLPFAAHARFVRRERAVSLDACLRGMQCTVAAELESRSHL